MADEILQEALDELDADAESLDAAFPGTGAGDKLRASVADGLARVLTNPRQYRPYDPTDPRLTNVHCHVLPNYGQYAVIYIAVPGRTVVLAIANGVRRPAYWAGRLRTAKP